MPIKGFSIYFRLVAGCIPAFAIVGTKNPLDGILFVITEFWDPGCLRYGSATQRHPTPPK